MSAQSTSPIRRRSLLLAACGLLAIPRVGLAQDAKRIIRIGWLGFRDDRGSTASSINLEGLRSGLRDRGWIEGNNIVIEQRNGDFSNAHELAEQLVKANVALVVAEGGMIFRVLGVSDKVPFLFHVNGDPVEGKLVASYSRPGGNRTGTSNLSETLSAKRVELLKEALPYMKQMAAIANQAHPGWPLEKKATEAAAKHLGLTLTWVAVYAAADIGPALDVAARNGAEGIVAVPDNVIFGQAALFADFAIRRGIPVISGTASFTEAGNFMSYGPVARDAYVKLAAYADKILRGAKASDLPVENPDRVELVINRKMAAEMKLQIPRPLQARADRFVD